MSTSRSTSAAISSISTWWWRGPSCRSCRPRSMPSGTASTPTRSPRSPGLRRAAAARGAARRAPRPLEVSQAQGAAEERRRLAAARARRACSRSSIWVPATVLADRPAKIASEHRPEEEETIANNIAALMRSAQQELIVISPYFVPGKEGVALMRELVAARGAHPHPHQLARLHRCAARAQRLRALSGGAARRWASSCPRCGRGSARSAPRFHPFRSAEREPAREGAGDRSENRVHRLAQHGWALGALQQRARARDAQPGDRPPGHRACSTTSAPTAATGSSLDASGHIVWSSGEGSEEKDLAHAIRRRR